MNKRFLSYCTAVTLGAIMATGCGSDEGAFDATGSFEAEERIISARAMGELLRFDIEEGQELKTGDTIGQVDVSLLAIQAQQVDATVGAIGQKTTEATPQVGILQAQLRTQEHQLAAVRQQWETIDKEVARFSQLVAAKAAPQKQLDDLVGQRAVLQQQLQAAEAQTGVIRAQISAANQTAGLQNRAVLSEVSPNEKRKELIEKQMADGTIINAFPGTVLGKYAMDGEFVTIGKPLYKIADLRTIILRAYISGDQLAKIQLSDSVTVLTDDGNGGMRSMEGVVEWISDKAEFTPKTIQTKNERANLVYAIKVRVQNDGSLKIGMYGEIKFRSHD
ncbi:MAG: HlyD family efflux transporter periplasmic adaptor subunit [Saprospiraceae bacterium]